MRVLVLGATGMLGQASMTEAMKRGICATGVARSGADVSIDIADSRQLKKVIEQLRPEVIINTIALTNIETCEKEPCLAYLINARSVNVMAEYARENGAYLIQISTDHYYTNDCDSRHAETSPVRLINEYTRTKFAGENFALTCPGALVVRTNIVGFRHKHKKDQPTFAEWVIQTLKNGLPITLFDDFFTSSIHVAQLSTALFDILDKHPCGILNLASRDVFNKKVFIEAIASCLGYSLSYARTGSVLESADVPRAESLGLDVTKAEKILGYRLPTMLEVVDSLISEYKETFFDEV